MTVFRNIECPFCGTSSSSWHVNDTSNYYGYDCAICKSYFISGPAAEKANSSRGSQSNLNCISENIRNNAAYEKEIITSWHLRRETSFPTMASNITKKFYEDIGELSIEHSKKSVDLLSLIANKTTKLGPFTSITLTLQELYSIKIATFLEAKQWLSKLYDQQLIHSESFQSSVIGSLGSNADISKVDLSLTADGWAEIERAHSELKSRKVFIAMQFTWEDPAIRTNFLEAVKLGCSDCGYEANIVSQDHTDQITDRIVAEIKSSKFVIADFTYNNQGAYYEAGLARGLGKKVIHTVKKGHTDDKSNPQKCLHFDIRQINYIEWDDPTEIREKIRDRIRSVVES